MLCDLLNFSTFKRRVTGRLFSTEFSSTLFQTNKQRNSSEGAKHSDICLDRASRQTFCTNNYLPTVTLTVIWYSITHSLFLSNLPSLQILPTAALPFFYLNIYYVDSPDCFTVISKHICFLLLVFFPVFTLFRCRFRAAD